MNFLKDQHKTHENLGKIYGIPAYPQRPVHGASRTFESPPVTSLPALASRGVQRMVPVRSWTRRKKYVEIAHGVYSVGQHKGGHVHAFLLEDDAGSLTLIDTLYDTDARLILDYIRGIRREVTDLERILLAHGHRPHLGGLAILKILSNATIHSHRWEADIIAGERMAQPVPLWPMRPMRAYWRVSHLQLGGGAGAGQAPTLPGRRADKR